MLRLDGKIGDTITITGFLKELSNNGWEIDIIARESNQFIYQYLPQIFKLIPLKKGVVNFFKTFKKVRQLPEYDTLICSTHILDPASLFFSRFIKAKNKIVFQNEEMSFFDFHVTENFHFSHVTTRYKQILKMMNFSKEDLSGVCQYHVEIPIDTLNMARSKVNSLRTNSDTRVIVLNSFAGAKLRNFSFETTRAIIEGLIASMDCVVISIANQGDLNILKSWRENYNQKKWIFFDEGDFAFNAALLHLSDVVVTPDTSIVHLSSAVSDKLVAVYREDDHVEANSVIWAPALPKYEGAGQTKGHKIIYALGLDINNVDVAEIVNSVKLLATSPV
ncbi:MAG: glycosyltransferase family 9 protein [Pseudobdellovibrio sp.]